MGIPGNRTGTGRRNPAMRPCIFLSFALVLLLMFGPANRTAALQKHTLDESGAAGQAKTGQKAPEQEASHAAVPQQPAQSGHATAPAQPQAEKPGTHSQAATPEAQLGTESHGAAPGAGAEHAAAAHEGGEHGVVLPEISPIPGVTFVDTLIKLMDHELHGRTLGWRPNDLIIGRFTDNINNYQLGVLEAVRFTSLRLKDSLTRMGDADTYDPDLEQAVNLFMNSATLWWFPSAESSYNAAIDHLKRFKTKLETGKRSFYYRRDNLVALLSTYKDLLGNVNRTLIMPSGWFDADDHFYYAQGVAHVYFEILKVCRVGFKTQLAVTMHGMDIMDEVLHELHTAEQISPWIILNSDFSGLLANHRANLNAPLSEAAHLLGVLSQL